MRLSVRGVDVVLRLVGSGTAPGSTTVGCTAG